MPAAASRRDHDQDGPHLIPLSSSISLRTRFAVSAPSHARSKQAKVVVLGKGG
jgi:hypothetical protein